MIGSTAISLAVLLATFMGGMCLGSILFPQVISMRQHPLRVYAAIEFGTGVLGIVVLNLMPAAGRVYTAWAGYGLRGFLLRGMVAAACLLAPTVLMGATLPALARTVDAMPQGISWMGSFYTANLAGAVFGCLLSGFYLLREFDVTTATYAAIAISVTVACFAATLAWAGDRPTAESADASREQGGEASLSRAPAVYIAIGLSGFCALSAEAIWTRLLGLLVGASVYALALIMAVFLVGLGAGSGIGSLLCRVIARRRLALGWCQLLGAGAIAWTAYNLAAWLPYWPIDPSISSNIWFNFQLDLDRAFWALLPATLLWGASFPLALAAAAGEGKTAALPAAHKAETYATDGGKLMASVYSANTAGAIAGALIASLLLMAWIGSQDAERVLIAVSAIAGLLLIIPELRFRSKLRTAAALVAGAVICLGLIRTVPPISKLLIAYGRYAATWVDKSDIVYAAEGLNSSVAVANFPSGARTFHVAGKIQASNVPRDMRLQRMLGHLTTLTVARPESVLVIGCGAGITAGAVSIDPRVKQETIVEIEPLVPRAASAYFSGPNFDVLHNPKAQVHIDDGRHFLLTTREHFDGITVDPLDPWVKGAANLYTVEFLDSMKQHLNPGGSVTMYIQLFETNLAAVKSAVATFFTVFPNGTIWGNPYQGKGHDMVLLGTVEPLHINLDEMERRIGYRGSPSRVAQSLAEIDMNSPEDLFATYAGQRPDLKDWLRGAAINRDRNLRMEYLAGIGLNLDNAAGIYAGLLRYRRFPEDVFTGSAGRVESLRLAMQRER